ncbi:MAG: glycosyltransferase [Candidatus Gastranaerophilales bacterium]|nr:glycosyltransferase [Candidatus Gastranaerophilales bacterium]
MSEKISIIIPVYRVETYLPKCIDSVISQTYQNLEIILVDDGSPDRCGQICDEYAERDDRIHVIHKKNEGVARARNDGIEYASGDYISFIDSDDWIAGNAYEILYRGLQRYGADCAVGRCVRAVDRDGKLTFEKQSSVSVKCETAEEAMKHVLLTGSAVWNRLFKRKVFAQVRFPVGRVNDDEVVALHAYAECDKIVFLDSDTYYYRIRKNSITTAKFSVRNVDCYYNSKDNLDFVKQKMPDLAVCAEYKYIKTMLYSYINLLRLKKDSQVRELLKQLQEDIRKNKKLARDNPYVTIPMKVLMYVCGEIGKSNCQSI